MNYYPWIYHVNHGWMYVYGTDPTSIWLWTTDMGFLWSSSTVYPFLWNNTGQTWLYYIIGSHNPRSFTTTRRTSGSRAILDCSSRERLVSAVTVDMTAELSLNCAYSGQV